MEREFCEFRWLAIPYRAVRESITEHPELLVESATASGLQHGGDLTKTLGVDVAGMHLERRVEVTIEPATVTRGPFPIVQLPVSWHATDHPRRYPVLNGVLEAYPISESRTQVSFQGQYSPPLGRVGAAIDAVVLHRVADATIEAFIDDVATRLRTQWSATRPQPGAPASRMVEPDTGQITS